MKIIYMKQNNYHLYNLIATSLQFVKPQPEVDVLESKKIVISDRILYNKQAQKSS